MKPLSTPACIHVFLKASRTWLILAAILLPAALAAQEICNNGIDDDGDGLIDLNDPDCPCSTLLTPPDVTSYIRNHSFEERGCCPLGFVSPPYTPPWLDCATGWHQATGATSDYFHECGYSPAGFNLPPPDGDGSVGFFAGPGYFEYVGTCLTYPAPANPLIAGTTYTLSLWITCGGGNGQFSQNPQQANPAIFTDQLPLAIFGYANECVPFPVATSDCIGYEPGWNELGRVMVQPAWEWVRVSITFTPNQDIHSIMIGGACDTPASYGDTYNVVDASGNATSVSPYFIVDELMLTIAQDQVMSPTFMSGNLCAENVIATAHPPTGATNYQWYRDGVALPGQTSTILDVSAGDYGPGMYTMASTFNGECLMGSVAVAPVPIPTPFPSLHPASGCAPLTVALADTTGGTTHTILWTLGDGSTSADSALAHTYTTPGVYDVSLRVRNDAGCFGDTLLTGAVHVFPTPNGQVTVTPDPVDAEDPAVIIAGSASGNIISWWWDLGAAQPPTSTDQQISALFPPVPGDYPVMLVVMNAEGCADTVRSVVRVIDPGVIELPNVFSPNGDGHNDRFVPIGYKGAPGLMEIYNRWGQMIFSTRNLAQGWSGSGAPDGTYFFIVTPDAPGAQKLTGHVTLVR